MIKTKKAQLGDQTLKWAIGIISFLIAVGAIYFLFKYLGVV